MKSLPNASDKKLTAAILGYTNWDDACDYRLTGEQERNRDRVLNVIVEHRLEKMKMIDELAERIDRGGAITKNELIDFLRFVVMS